MSSTNVTTIGRSKQVVRSDGPLEANITLAKIDAIITLATKTKDWPLLEEAVAAKIEEQETFVTWWNDNVVVSRSVAKWGGLSERESLPNSERIPVKKAERPEQDEFDPMMLDIVRQIERGWHD